MSYKKCCKCGGLVHSHEFDEASETCHLCIELAAEAKKAEKAEYGRKYREANRDSIAKKQKEYREANKEKIAEARKAYKATPEGWAKHLAGVKRWQKRNPDKMASTWAKRRATKLNADSDDWTRTELHEEAGGRCFYCNKEVTLRQMDADHYIPLSKGGSNLKSNMRCSCRSCNRKKHDKMPEDFIGETL